MYVFGQILQSHLADLVKSHLEDVLEPKRLSEVLGQLAASAEVYGTKGRKYVDQERFMGLIMEERRRLLEAGVDLGSGRGVKGAAVTAARPPAPVALSPIPEPGSGPKRRGVSLDRGGSSRTVSTTSSKPEGGSVWPILNALKLVQKVYQVRAEEGVGREGEGRA